MWKGVERCISRHPENALSSKEAIQEIEASCRRNPLRCKTTQAQEQSKILPAHRRGGSSCLKLRRNRKTPPPARMLIFRSDDTFRSNRKPKRIRATCARWPRDQNTGLLLHLLIERLFKEKLLRDLHNHADQLFRSRLSRLARRLPFDELIENSSCFLEKFSGVCLG